ncbi:hypothetical protein HAP48_0027400 [Bradyrhizobium septentrionale]|uniref:Uncharacterized protein n=1 Tax=Bradyrhizobium septentrionale TaxID=1404411 RepID=A0A974A0F9_9BRAD|nr:MULTISPECIES: hypothetical protein [Bradyrhizobium]MCK7667890.1 hypothetical protein [Bradyrhizobium sp. 2S1]UGY12379.1 hypothetical protein HAP48_0027400 [Bradyrhizobium septentrionale]UGY25512.1 hypothetical protein HU675_0000795 [Bradyrhizobium septentrionale]
MMSKLSVSRDKQRCDDPRDYEENSNNYDSCLSPADGRGSWPNTGGGALRQIKPVHGNG